MRLFRSLPVLLLAVACHADDAGAQFSAAFAGNEFQAKRDAIAALTSSGQPKLDIMRTLIGVLGDRQGGALALTTLRSLAGVSNDPPDWGKWLEDQVLKEQVAADLKKRKEDDEKAKQAKNAAPTEDEKPAEKAPEAAPIPLPDDLGKPDRIYLKSGGSFVGYIRTKRVDADGKLVSLRVVHLEGAGEETIAASLIARVVEDVE